MSLFKDYRSTRTTDQRLSVALFFAVVASALYLAPEIAHVVALPNKIVMSEDQYYEVQTIYDGWWQFAYVLVVQVIAIGAVIVLARRESLQFWCGLLAMLCVIGAQVIFWGYTQPANSITKDWTVRTENWQLLRDQWESAHAASAVLVLVAFVVLVAAAVWRPGRT